MKKQSFISFCLLLYVANCYAQKIENKDTLLVNSGHDCTWQVMDFSNEDNNVRSPEVYDSTIILARKKDSLCFVRDAPINIEPFHIHNDLIRIAKPFIQLQNQEEGIGSSYFFVPYSYSFDSFIEGLTMKGFYGSHSFTDYLTTNINIYFSRSYFGNTAHPNFYINGSARAEFILKLHDRVQIVGAGQLSLREGLDPKIPSLMGGANYYGAGVQFKITNKVGVGVGFTNNYYHGEWTNRTYITPVGY
jgi:hypothetical protein